jgi:hypothetical protein
MAISFQSDDNNELMPVTPDIIGKITGSTPPVLNNERRRKIDYLAKNYNGCIVLVVKNGRIIKNGIYKVQQFIIGPTDQVGTGVDD